MIEQYRAALLADLEQRMRSSVETVANLAYAPPTMGADGRMVPGTSLENIAVQTIAMNARSRALHEAMQVVQAAYKKLVSPEQAPEGQQQKKEAPYG